MSIHAADAMGFKRVTIMAWELNRGDRFKVEGSDIVWTYRSMDGAYCYALSDDGQVLNWNGPVERVG